LVATVFASAVSGRDMRLIRRFVGQLRCRSRRIDVCAEIKPHMHILAYRVRLRARPVLFDDWSDAGDHAPQFTGSQIPCPESMPKNHESWRATWVPAKHLRLCRIACKTAWPHLLVATHHEVALKPRRGQTLSVLAWGARRYHEDPTN
jgi:hypothetical protein